MHASSIGVENARYLDFKAGLAMVIKEQSFGAAFAFIVTGTRSDRIDVTPVVLGLRMNRGITIDLACRGLQYAAFQTFGQAEHVDCAVHRRFGRLHWIVLILNG